MANDSVGTVDYLIQAASLLPNRNHSQKLLKSYYLTKSRKLLQSDGQQQKALFSDEEVCRKCSTPWSDTNYSLSIDSIKMTKSKARKILIALDDKTNPKKQKFAKKSAKKVNNVFTIKCNLCKNTNKIVLWKKIAELQQQKFEQKQKQKEIKEQMHDQDVTNAASKQRKRKRDKTAGLLYAVVKSDDDTKTDSINEKRPSPHPNVPNNQSSAKVKSKPNVSLGVKRPTVKLVNKSVPTILQKKSNLMQLANALKKKTTSQNVNSKLNKLLK